MSSEEATSSLFEFLHSEIIEYVYSSSEDVASDKCISQLESMGYRVGQSIAEQLTRDSQRFKDELDIMKFICRDFWTAFYKKQVNNLRTNHQGVFVLQDNKFRLLTRMSTGKEFIEHAPKYLAFPCGLVRGALASLGINSIVTAEVVVMPAVKFQIMVQKN
ncbi:trafficking protein particle complex subunit 6b-like [Styela clava]|uniref:trafficking protein particle complex subunit 6b-like n=1 Tax=Styela clava TaxID=7725 RepID=UPI00193AD506|nr:trafficking protein particle complex subunit 6b-like [Styela clava]